MDPEIRYRGIYEVVLYRAECTVEGSFIRPDVGKLGINPANVEWDEAFVSYGITDLQGIRDTITLAWNGTAYPSEPGVPVDDVFSSGITFKPTVGQTVKSFAFSIPLRFNGSTEIRFVPAGEVTDVSIKSPWGTPSFVGNFLPHSREIRADGFRAEWKVFNLNRNYPQAWTDNRYKILESSFGTTFFLPVDQYQKTTRSIKYALLFISLTFASFFMSELMAKVSLHPIHYTLIGFALVLFYMLLLSLSEHLRFDLAYLIASAGTTLLVSLYAYWISIRKQIAGIIFFILFVLYGFLFVVLQLEDYALLLGSVGLFVILATVMYLTRRIDWFAVNQSKA